MKLTLANENENYAARFVTLEEFEPIAGADKIKCALIKGYQVIVAADIEKGTKGVFFPIESQINKEFLSKNNLFSDKSLNADKEKESYFGDKGRVRAVKLRKTLSEGFFIPLSAFENWRGILAADWNKIDNNLLFDTVDGVELCKKYQIRIPRGPSVPGAPKAKKQPSRMIADQYRLHYSTNKFQDHAHLVSPEDYIYVDNKLHGTSLNCGRVLVKRILTNWEKVKKFFGFKVQLTEYENIYGSRTVIKSMVASNHFYAEDIWKLAFDRIKYALTDGISLYAEIVGYMPTGGAIQGKWNYGYKPGEFGVYVYRVTHTDSEGNVTEYPMSEVVKFCEDNKLNHVPIFYHGLARDLFPELETGEHWHREFLKKLSVSFNMEKPCGVCKNGAPAEGLVIRNDTKMNHALKLKAKAFLVSETLMLDKGEVDIESEEFAEV